MPKGYLIAQIDVNDPDPYTTYMAANAVAFGKYGARFLVRNGQADRVEGTFRSRLIVLEFADYATARACYHSPEYAAAMAIRRKHSVGDVVIVGGVQVLSPAKLSAWLPEQPAPAIR